MFLYKQENINIKVKILFSKYLLVVNFVFFTSMCYCQNEFKYTWPYIPHAHFKERSDYYTASIGVGYIIKKDNDTLNGYIKMLQYNKNEPSSYYIPIMPFGKEKANEIINVDRKDIDRIIVNVKLPDTNSNSNEYVNLYDTDMWILLGKNGAVGIYYNFWHISSRHSKEEIILVTKKSKTLIYNSNALGIYNGRKVFLRFINKNYKLNLGQNNFKDEKEMMNYILNKENKQETSKTI